jgi:hypothetical protein
MREAELDELKRKLEEAGRVDVGRAVRDTVDPTGSLSADFDPAEFSRDLKRRVEDPPAGPVSGAATGDRAEPPPPSEAEPRKPADGDPSGVASAQSDPPRPGEDPRRGLGPTADG